MTEPSAVTQGPSRLDDQIVARLSKTSFVCFVFVAVISSIAASLLLFSPRFILWDLANTVSFETARAVSFLSQCENPWRTDVEDAVRWRLLPPLICHWLGLRGWLAFIAPWSGVLALVAGAVGLFVSHGVSRTRSLIGGFIIATSSAVIVPLGFLGMNDGWSWLALLVVVAARSPVAVIAAILLGSWVDERMVIGLPLAIWSRTMLFTAGRPTRADVTCHLLFLLWIIPYLSIRLLAQSLGGNDGTVSFLSRYMQDCLTWLPFAPLGWWMALRAGWLPAVHVFVELHSQNQTFAFRSGFVISIGTLILATLLAADLSRSAAISLPLFFLGWVRLSSVLSRSHLLLLVLAQALLPAAHVIYNKIGLINPLPIELFRLLRQVS